MTRLHTIPYATNHSKKLHELSISTLCRRSEMDSSSHVAEGVRKEAKGGGVLEVKGETVVNTKGGSSPERDRGSGQPLHEAKESQLQGQQIGGSKKKADESNIGRIYIPHFILSPSQGEKLSITPRKNIARVLCPAYMHPYVPTPACSDTGTQSLQAHSQEGSWIEPPKM